MEYLPFGDLLGYLRKSRGHSDNYNKGDKKPESKLTARDLLSFAWMIADGMQYLAKMQVIWYNSLQCILLLKLIIAKHNVYPLCDFTWRNSIPVSGSKGHLSRSVQIIQIERRIVLTFHKTKNTMKLPWMPVSIFRQYGESDCQMFVFWVRQS